LLLFLITDYVVILLIFVSCAVLFAGDELLSDSFPYKEIENGILWEVEGKVQRSLPCATQRPAVDRIVASLA
jgi:hypothetical protein